MMQCNRCDATLRNDQTFCTTCGASVDHAAPEPQPKSKKTKVILAVIAGITVLALAVLFFLLGQHFPFTPNQPAVDLNSEVEWTTTTEDPTPWWQLGLPATPASFHVTANAYMRAQADAEAESLAQVGIATHVLVLEYYSEDWFRVQYDDVVGYIAAEYLSQFRRVNIGLPEVLNADRATLDRLFGRGAVTAPRDNDDGTSTHDILYDNGVTVTVVTWREGGQDRFRVHSISVNYRNNFNNQRFHLHGVDGNTRRDGILDALGETADASHGRFDFRDGDIHMRVHFSDSVSNLVIRVDFAEHHFRPPPAPQHHYYW